MIKVLVILDSLCFGGREKIVVDTCNALDPRRYQVTIVTLCYDNNPLKEKLRPDITFHSLPVKEKEITNVQSVLFLFKGLPALIRYIRVCDPDIIHTHSSLHRLLLTNMAISRANVHAKCYHSIHTSGLHYSNDTVLSKLKRRVEKMAFSLVRPRLIAVSPVILENNEKFYKQYYIDNRCIPNGIDTGIFAPGRYEVAKGVSAGNTGDLNIVYPARLVAGKNHSTLLKAFKIVADTEKNVRLVLAGDGEMKEMIQSYVSENGLVDKVVLLGNVTDVPETLAAAHIGAFPSEYEGFGIGLIEMMAMELPVVASDIPLFRKYVDHLNDGMLCPVFDEQQMASMLLQLIRSEELRKLIGRNARNKALQYSIETSVNSLTDYYDS